MFYIIFSNGRFLTLKYTTIGRRLHSLTGMKAPVTQLHQLGHFISYDMVCQIETGQAELAQQQQNQLIRMFKLV